MRWRRRRWVHLDAVSAHGTVIRNNNQFTLVTMLSLNSSVHRLRHTSDVLLHKFSVLANKFLFPIYWQIPPPRAENNWVSRILNIYSAFGTHGNILSTIFSYVCFCFAIHLASFAINSLELLIKHSYTVTWNLQVIMETVNCTQTPAAFTSVYWVNCSKLYSSVYA